METVADPDLSQSAIETCSLPVLPVWEDQLSETHGHLQTQQGHLYECFPIPLEASWTPIHVAQSLAFQTISRLTELKQNLLELFKKLIN